MKSDAQVIAKPFHIWKKNPFKRKTQLKEKKTHLKKLYYFDNTVKGTVLLSNGKIGMHFYSFKRIVYW